MGLISIDGYEPPHLSYSTVDSYRSCGKKFQLQKILQLEQVPGIAATAGSAVHKATEILDLAEFFGQSLDIGNDGAQE